MWDSSETLLKQLKITRIEIDRRKEYLGFDKEACTILSSLRQIVGDNIDQIVEAFYRRILPFKEMDQVIGDAETLHRLKNYQRNYILTLFDGEYDQDYVHSRLRVGVVHKRIGVAPKFYVSAVYNLISILRTIVIKHSNHDCRQCENELAAIEKILMFDLSLAIDTYIYSLMGEVERSKDELENYTDSLEEIIQERTQRLQEQARVDGLTSLLNQKTFYEELKRELLRGQRRNHSTALIYCDLDGFKALNDTEGHKRGDEILVLVARTLEKELREVDVLARYGGDEFCIILCESDLESAQQLCRRLCSAIEKATPNTGISCSMGIALSSIEEPLDADSMVNLADSRMYDAKEIPGFSFLPADED